MSNTELGAINTEPTGGVVPVETSVYQGYSYTFTATSAQEYLSFLFRNDPGFTWLDTVALVAQTDVSGRNLLNNGDFDAGGQPGNSSLPIGWSAVGTTGLDFAGALGTADSNLDQGPDAKPQSGTYFWVDGATQGYDGLTQQVALTVGATYTVSFQLAVNPNFSPPDTDGPNAGIDTQIWVGDTPQTIAACFTRGTDIMCEREGQRRNIVVEALQVGDLVVTAKGSDDGVQPIVWIGRSPFDAARHPRLHQVLPVRIRAGALADGLPVRDLIVSPGHSLLLDGVLIQAERLINGATIVRDEDLTRGEYFHVELASHDILLSEGVPSESYLDTGNRSAFVNAAGPVDLHPNFASRDWRDTCRELVQDGPVLTAVRQRLIARAEALGWTRRHDATPRVTVDGRTLAPLRCDGRKWLYAIPAGAGSIRLVSTSAVAAETMADAHDRRRLGLQVEGVAVTHGLCRRDLSLDDPILIDGWHAPEASADATWRWTDGDAGIALDGPCRLEIAVARGLPAWSCISLEAWTGLALTA